MNLSHLATFSTQARRDFIEAVTARAAQYGLTAKKIEPMIVEGDVAMIAGKPYSKAVGEKRKKLEARINRDGFEQTMEAMAYTWFNRLVAIRFMELHEYLDHGYRALSHPQGHSLPEIVEHAEHVDLPGLDKKKVIELKLDGTKEEELYRMLLIGQCNALSKAMPFLFKSIDDETELLLPDHLLHSDSIIRNLTGEIPEQDWQEVEIIGWLYQFYISEKKGEVIGKVVKSEDIPAATQLFTPNWIVKYLVQNSLGRQWLATYPDSPLRGQMEYYIEQAEQTPEVEAKLAEVTPASLNPEELTLCDPACGSGHILVEAYDLLKAIYQERGRRPKDIPRLILEKNLYGLEIDDRAAQLAAFALTMKARADDRNIFERDVQPQVLSIQESVGLDATEITEALNAPLPDGSTGEISQADVAELIGLFEHAKTYGSLIELPQSVCQLLSELSSRLRRAIAQGGLLEKATARQVQPIVEQALLFAMEFTTVVTNPPYMGSGFYNTTLKNFVYKTYSEAKSDLYAAFMLRNLHWVAPHGYVAMITIPNWMFIQRFEEFRGLLLEQFHILTLINNGRGIWGADFGSCAFVIRNGRSVDFAGTYKKLFEKQGSVATQSELRERFFSTHSFASTTKDFMQIPGHPIVFWTSARVRDAFEKNKRIGDLVETREGLATGDNDRFLREWHEVDAETIHFDCTGNEEAARVGKKWFCYVKGGPYRKWYGNTELVVNWQSDGRDVKANVDERTGRVRSHNYNGTYAFREGITWSGISISALSVRYVPVGFMFDAKGPMAFSDKQNDLLLALAILNSVVGHRFIGFLAPTVDFKLGHIMNVPAQPDAAGVETVVDNARKCIKIAQEDWSALEASWLFKGVSYISEKHENLPRAIDAWREQRKQSADGISALEQENNDILIQSFQLENESSFSGGEGVVSIDVPIVRECTERLVSYAIGCMMGRYSLDEPGLIYAHSKNEGFDLAKYNTFPADEDGIVPLTEFHWFEDDAANRFEEFIASAWPKVHLEENLGFVAESLGQKRDESSRDTIRRYLSGEFIKDHLSLFKKRPIYWLFSSGKQRGFQALVYLHRYNEGTLARLRTEYVIPLLGKMTARIDHLTDDIAAASSSQHQKRLEKEKATVVKQLAEVQEFDEKLRHYADQRISLDLDDGVKVNYGKFGTLLAEVKAVTGKKAED